MDWRSVVSENPEDEEINKEAHVRVHSLPRGLKNHGRRGWEGESREAISIGRADAEEEN